LQTHSSDDVAIRLENVSKQYALDPESPLSLSDFVKRPRSLLHKLRGREPFWALRDVSLDVPRGQVLGVMGGNGQGKSTLLRVMVGLSAPSSGTATIHGRFAALLELGSGFHPRATGRENAYINALFMGLSKREAREKLPEMIKFAGLEAFADQPIRTYSSGMQLRLGFAVAVHTQPEIMLIDEVLSVGDAEFQQKCFDHFATLKDRGVTIVLVSHNMVTLRDFTDRVILIEKGQIARDGDPKTVVREYLAKQVQESPAARRRFGRSLQLRGFLPDEDDAPEAAPGAAPASDADAQQTPAAAADRNAE